MAASAGKRKTPASYPNLNEDDFIKDVVESLDLTIPDGELPSLLEKIRSKTDRFSNDSLHVTMSIFEVLSKECPVPESFLLSHVFEKQSEAVKNTPKEEDQKWSGLSKREEELVQQYIKNGSIAASDASWTVLQKVGMVNSRLSIGDFVAAAMSKKKDFTLLQFADFELLKQFLSKVSKTDYITEKYLGVVCAMLFGFCVDWLELELKPAKFIYRVDSPIPSQRGVSDLCILRIGKSNSTDTIAIVEIKRKLPSVLGLMCGDAEYSNSLAQLVYMGKVTSYGQNFMPLLVLTNCALWHIFDLDKDGQPQRYCYVPPGGRLALSTTVTFDVPVFSEVIAFVQRHEKEFSSVQSQQQPAVQ